MYKQETSRRRFKAGYTIVHGIVDGSEYGMDDFNSSHAETPGGAYIGNGKMAHMLCVKNGIVPEKASPGHSVCSIGFCEKEQKWYGWSHRAIYGFGIGSQVSHGDCAYVSDTPEGLIEDRAAFFADISEASAQEKRDECQILDDRSGIRILHTPMQIPMAQSLGDALNHIEDETAPDVVTYDPAYTEVKCGRGEWTAKTLEDAKQMAVDFAAGVS